MPRPTIDRNRVDQIADQELANADAARVQLHDKARVAESHWQTYAEAKYGYAHATPSDDASVMEKALHKAMIDARAELAAAHEYWQCVKMVNNMRPSELLHQYQTVPRGHPLTRAKLGRYVQARLNMLELI